MNLFRSAFAPARRKSNRLQPRLESFEDRCVPAILFPQSYVSGGTLFLTTASRSWGEPHTVIIQDNGSSSPGNIHIIDTDSIGTTDFHPSQSIWRVVETDYGGSNVVYSNTNPIAAGVYRQIEVSLGPVDSTFTGIVTGLNQGAGLHLIVNGGTGSDVLNTFVMGTLQAGSDLGISEFGGLGWDVVSVDAYTFSPTIASGATLWTNLCGDDYGQYNAPDAGNDVSLYYRGLMNGRLQFSLQGSGGNDWVAANLTFSPGSVGSVGDPYNSNDFHAAQVSGGAGNDDLVFLVGGDFGNIHYYNTYISGGAGDDTATYTWDFRFPLWTEDFVEHRHLR